jgi:hypothetical protein
MKKRIVALGLLLALCVSASALDEGQVSYVGGTAPGLTANTIGKFDLTQTDSLVFEHSGTKFAIPYTAIESFEYTREVTRHLGVLPAIGVGLVKARRHSHFFRISYSGDNTIPQVVIFEVPKHMPPALQAVLAARAPQTCKPIQKCGQRQ